jgi:abhydrolase domain-containing protein 6
MQATPVYPMQLRERIGHSVGKAQYLAAMRLLRRLAGVREDVATVDGVRVPLLVRGDIAREPPVVMVHGFGGDKEGWLLMASGLRRRRPLLLLDLPGFGAAGPIPRQRASARKQADVLARLLDRAGQGRAHLVGSSMGGGIVLRFARTWPDRVASLTLVGSVGPVVEQNETLRAIERGENPLIPKGGDDFDRLLELVAERPLLMTRPMRLYLRADRYARADAHTDLFEGWYRHAPDEGPPEDLEQITAPALVIHGERDRVIHRATGEALARRLPNARLELLSGIGHVPQLEVPRIAARLVERFLSSVA